jgi:hypothetical protein
MAALTSVAHAAFVVEAHASGLGSEHFTATGNASLASTAWGTTAGNSIYCGTGAAGSSQVLIASYTPGADADNLVIPAGTDLGNGHLATGVVGGNGGTYNVYYTVPDTGNVEGRPDITVTSDGAPVVWENRDQNGHDSDENQRWFKLAGPVTLSRRNTYTVTIDASGDWDHYVAMRCHGVLWEAVTQEGCINTEPVTVAGLQVPGDTVVTVTEIDRTATAVNVYAVADGEPTAIGTTEPGGLDTVDVGVFPPLVLGHFVSATQVVDGIEGCIPLSHREVGACEQITEVSINEDLVAGMTSATVEGVAADAEAVTVYATTGAETTPIGTNSSPGGASSVVVTVTPLVSGDTISATQTREGLEGCVLTTGPVVDSCGQVPPLSVCGLPFYGDGVVTVKNVDAAAQMVTIYATATDITRVIGSTNPEGAALLDVPVAALVLGDVITATQTLMVSGQLLEGCPSSGTTVRSEPLLVADFESGVHAADHPDPGEYGVWYDVSNNAYGSALPIGLFGSPAMQISDGGWTNGVYCIFESAIPRSGYYHLQAEMMVDEQAIGANWNAFSRYQLGVRVNGTHRHPAGALTGITGASYDEAVGNYLGLTIDQDGYGIETASQVVHTGMIVGEACDDILVACSTDVGGWYTSSSWLGTFMMVDNIRLMEPELPCNDPFADGDRDGDVDQEDFGRFQKCHTGTDGGVLPGCGCFNRDADNDVDQDDLGAFENCASGPAVVADPTCDN